MKRPSVPIYLERRLHYGPVFSDADIECIIEANSECKRPQNECILHLLRSIPATKINGDGDGDGHEHGFLPCVRGLLINTVVSARRYCKRRNDDDNHTQARALSLRLLRILCGPVSGLDENTISIAWNDALRYHEDLRTLDLSCRRALSEMVYHFGYGMESLNTTVSQKFEQYQDELWKRRYNTWNDDLGQVKKRAKIDGGNSAQGMRHHLHSHHHLRHHRCLF